MVLKEPGWRLVMKCGHWVSPRSMFQARFLPRQSNDDRDVLVEACQRGCRSCLSNQVMDFAKARIETVIESGLPYAPCSIHYKIDFFQKTYTDSETYIVFIIFINS